MIESIQRIHTRIGEIRDTFNKLGFSPVNTRLPVKPFSEYLNEALRTVRKIKSIMRTVLF